MKKGIHPENYRTVVFKDMSNGDVFLSRSTVNTKETIEFEGETYTLVKLEISSTSHPFYTGKSLSLIHIFSHMPESSVCHVVFYLSKHSLWFYTPPASMLDTFFLSLIHI